MQIEQYKNLRNYFLTLEQDLSNTSKFVEHCEDNFKTYSFEFYKIIQLSCAEIDSILKELCKLWDTNSKAQTIKDYAKIIIPNYSQLHRFSTHMIYSSTPLLFFPWKEWTLDSAPLWWRHYQKLKHNHTDNFHLATLENAYLCLSAHMIALDMIKWTFEPTELNFYMTLTQRLSIDYVCSTSPQKR